MIFFLSFVAQIYSNDDQPTTLFILPDDLRTNCFYDPATIRINILTTASVDL